MRRDHEARLGDSDGRRDWSLGEFDVLRARKRSSERMHMALRMRMTTGDDVSCWYVSVAATGCLGLTVEDPADEPHGVRCCGFRSRRAKVICLVVSCAGDYSLCKSQVFASKLSPKGDRPGWGVRMPCPARPVKDDRVLACASALDPCNSGRCPLSTGGLACAPLLLDQLYCSLRPAGLLVPS